MSSPRPKDLHRTSAVDHPTTWSVLQIPLAYGRRVSMTALAWRLGQLSIFALMVVAWELIGLWRPILAVELSSPGLVIQELRGMLDLDGWHHVWVTLSTAAFGCAVGTAMACIATLVLASNRLLRNFLSPFIVILNAVPRVALAPLFILWFGIGIRAGTAFVIAIIFFLVFVNLFTGVQTIDRLYLMNARALGGGKLWILREVYIPSVLAWLIASLRNAVALALLGAAVAELIAGTAGLGFLIAQGTNSGNSAEVIAAALILALVTLLANSVISRVERNLLAWQLSQ